MTSHTTAKFHAGEVELFYRQFGRPGATPLCIIHGLSYFSYDWIGAANALAVDRPVAAMDMRGFGESGWSKDYSVQRFAKDIVALADQLDWQQTVLIGHSMGGRNCCVCAGENPQRVKALVLVDWAPQPASAGTRRIAETVAGVPDRFESVEQAMDYFKSTDRGRFEAYLKPVPGGLAIRRDPYFRDQFRRQLATGERAGHGVDLWAMLGTVRCPILLIRGARSDLLTAEIASKMRSTNTSIELVELDTGHNVVGEDPEGFTRAVRDFLSRQGV